ncbi:MAG: glycosyltransferase family 2 protein [Deltaproteobacteria bacterium]|nr:glycosyltransferase family 2 protein [Deltaproteobacteria bacterium]
MKLIIQIPCFNEEESLPIAVANLPRSIPGIDVVEWLIIDDGSSDKTREVAQKLGVHHIVGFPTNQGLARGFMLGIRSCLERGADIIVNTDADDQYNADDIPVLIAPILRGEAEIVVGERPIATIEHFSFIKKVLQKLGSSVVAGVSGTRVRDAPSGFRAFSRNAAARLNVFSSYTYTLETIIQAGQKNMGIVSVPIRVNRDLRPSRLVRGMLNYVARSIATMLRIAVVYRPFRFFLTLAAIFFAAGAVLSLRFVYFYATGDGGGHIQSVVLGTTLLVIGFQTALLAFIADLQSVNRRLLEELLEDQRKRRGA